jgi:hypothetical protein
VNQPEVMIGLAAEQFDEHGKLNEKKKESIRELLQNLVSLSRTLRDSRNTAEVNAARS